MLDSHRLQIERTEIQNKLNSDRFFELKTNDADYETRMGEHKALRDQLSEVNNKYIEATQREALADEVAMAGQVNGEARMTAELRELRETAKKAHLDDYMLAARDGRPASGAAGEYNTHVFGHNAAGDFPIEMLGDRSKIITFDAEDWRDIMESENRASLTGTGVNPGASTSYISQLFAMSEAAFCGASFPAVGVGDHSYPIFSKSTTAGDFARDAAEPAPAGSLTINTAVNRRLQSTMELAGEDENRIPNIAGGLVNHLRAGLQETLDNYVIDQLFAALGTAISATTAIETISHFLSRVGSAVDGRRAFNVGDVRGLMNTVPASAGTDSVFSLLSSLSVSVGGSHFWEMPRLSDPNYFRGSAHLGAVSSNDGHVILMGIGSGVNLGRLQVPIWRRGQMLRDTGVGQLSGTVRYTVAMYAAVEVTATDQHVLHELKVT